MTNIGIVGKRNKQGELEFITAIADSQGTDLRSRSKNDTSLKIFIVGKNCDILLLGTGNGSVIVRTAEMLRNEESIDSAQETAEAVLHYTHRHYVESTKGKPERVIKTGDFADFLIGGPSKHGLAMFKVNTSGYRGDPKADKYQNRAVEPIKVVSDSWGGMFDGSAWRHINLYLQGQQESGRPIIIETISDALIESHDLSLRGARDIGVNDKLHYGIVTYEKTVRLIHPQTNFSNTKELIDYVKRLTGIDAGAVFEGFDDAFDPVKNSLAIDSWNRISSLTSSFYFALSSELSCSSSYKQEYTRISEMFYRNPAFEERLKEIATKRRESLNYVDEGVKAALSGNARKLRSYIDDSIRRGNEARDNLFKQFGLS